MWYPSSLEIINSCAFALLAASIICSSVAEGSPYLTRFVWKWKGSYMRRWFEKKEFYLIFSIIEQENNAGFWGTIPEYGKIKIKRV